MVEEYDRKGSNLIKHLLTRLLMKMARSVQRKHHGVSPVLATIMIFGLIITGVMITFIQVVPYIEQAQSEEAIATVRNSFLELDTTIKTLLSETGTPGGFRTVLISKPAGNIKYKPSEYHFSFRLIDHPTWLDQH